MHPDTSLHDPDVARAEPPQWLTDYLSARVERGGQRHFLTRCVAIDADPAQPMTLPEGHFGALSFRAAAPHHFCNLVILDREIAALSALDRLGPTVAEIRTTREFRLLLAVSMPVFEDLATRFAFLPCLDALCDRVSERIARQCLIEGCGPLDDGTADPDRAAPTLVLVRVFP